MDKVRRIYVDAELFKGDEGCGTVGFVDGEVVDGDCERKRAEFHIFDFHLSTDELFGVVDDVVLDDSRCCVDGGDDEDDQSRENDKDDIAFLHVLKIELLFC